MRGRSETVNKAASCLAKQTADKNAIDFEGGQYQRCVQPWDGPAEQQVDGRKVRHRQQGGVLLGERDRGQSSDQI